MIPGNASTTTTSGKKTTGEELDVSEIPGEKSKLVNSLSEGFVPGLIKLLFNTVSALLGTHDWARVAPFILRLLMNLHTSSIVGKKRNDIWRFHALFGYLVMHRAEKNLRGMGEVDMRSLDDRTRL